jgi:hypothetical protein
LTTLGFLDDSVGHVHSTKNIGIKVLDGNLAALLHLVLAANDLVNTTKVLLNLLTVRVFRDLAASSHVLDIVSKLAATRTSNFLILDITLVRKSGLGTSRESDILVDW